MGNRTVYHVHVYENEDGYNVDLLDTDYGIPVITVDDDDCIIYIYSLLSLRFADGVYVGKVIEQYEALQRKQA